MIESISNASVVDRTVRNYSPLQKSISLPQQKNNFVFSKEASQALKLNALNFARTIKFTGALAGAFDDLNQVMVTCKTKWSKGKKLEK